MQNLKVGHFSNRRDGTGVSVFLFEKGAVGAYKLCGSAPATHEVTALAPENSIANLHGLVLAGGSAYGLFSALGVMTYLTERGIGQKTPHGVVPIVPAAAIYDLNYKKAVPPTAENAYQACVNAKENNKASGSIGAGTGATVGKLVPKTKRMRSGLGRAELVIEDDIKVIAYAVVNSIGDIRNAAGKIVAGACVKKGQFVDSEKYLLSGKHENDLFQRTNTTLVAVFTNAGFMKDELQRIGKMAIAGIARAISPIFTPYDGDSLFTLSVGNKKASILTVGTIAAEAVRLAILDAVKESVIIR